MTRLTITGRLTAAEDRTLRGRLVPYNRPGYTNLGRVVVQRGGIDVPDDVSTLFASLDHLDGRDSVAEFTGIDDRDDGLWAEWTVPPTHGGDRLLAEYTAGTRTGISVELEPVQIRDGIATGRLIGCAFPEQPAFPEARLVAELAPDTPVDTPVDGDPDAPAAGGDDQPAEDDTEAPTEGDTMTTTPVATAPADLLTRATPQADTTPAATRLTAANALPTDVYRLLAEISTAGGANRARLLAALTDIVPADILDRDQPAWIGELWSGRAYQRRLVPLLSRGELTGLKVKGWRWVTKPVMAKYAGNKTAIPSAAIATESYEEEAQRFAGGHDIDRKYVDFKDAAFFASYFQAMTESYAKLTDAFALEVMKTEASALTPGSVPSGVPAGWAAVVDAALEIVDVGAPSFAIVEKSIYRDMLFTGTDKFLEFLNASIGFEEGTLNSSNFKLIPWAKSTTADEASTTGLDSGEILVGTRAAVTFRELGGGTPIRVSALDIANGGVDEGCFGYAHVDVHDSRGLRLVDLTTDSA